MHLFPDFMDTLYTRLSNSESLSTFSESSFFVALYSKCPWETHTYSFRTTFLRHEGQFGQHPKDTEVGSVSRWRVRTGGDATCFYDGV